jgi:hypothetical protein
MTVCGRFFLDFPDRADSAEAMSISLAPRSALEADLGSARDIALCSYTLSPDGPVARALEAAADRGARVVVRLDGHPTFGHAGSVDGFAGRVVRELSAHGVRVETTMPADPPAHLKAAVVDGVAYLDDRNWAARGEETIVRDDDPADVVAIRDAIAGRPAAGGAVKLEKSAALAVEAAAIETAPGDTIDIASESFGGCAVSVALAARAAAGTHVRLEVDAHVLAADRSGRERTLLVHLAAKGIEVRAVATNAKLAVCGDRAWLGSANATYAPGPMSDWGLTTFDPAIVDALGTTFARVWETGTQIS